VEEFYFTKRSRWLAFSGLSEMFSISRHMHPKRVQKNQNTTNK
jgi:hypothetical protein